MYQVPLPIEDVQFESFPDEGGFTKPEKIALRNAWALIIPRGSELAKEFFLDFYSDYEFMLNKFRDNEGVFKMYEFHIHTYQIFDFIGDMVFEGLDSLLQMHAIVSPMGKRHMAVGVTYDNIALILRVFGTFLKKVLSRYLSPTLEKGIDKICAIILAACTQGHVTTKQEE